MIIVAASTALHRLAPPSYLAAHTFFVKQGTAARRRGAARAARARRLQPRHAGGVARRVQHPRRPDRPVPDGLRAALPARPLRRRHRDHQHLRRRHAAHALPGARDPHAAGARVPAGRGRPHPLPRPLPRGVRGRPVEVAALQGRQQRHRAGRHRVLPAAVLRRHRHFVDYLPPDAVIALHGDVGGAARPLLAGHRVALPAAARRQGAPAAAAVRAVRPADAFFGAIKAFARSSCRAAAAGRRRDRRADAPLPAGAGRPARRRPARRAQALVEAPTGACWSSPRPPDAARRCSSTSPNTASSPPRWTLGGLPAATRRDAAAPLHAGFLWPAAKLAFVTEAELYASIVRRARRDAARRSNVDAMVRDLSEVRIGDPVVHEQHGIGRYLGLVSSTSATAPPSSCSSSTPTTPSSTCRCRACTSSRATPARARRRAAARARQRPVGEGEGARRSRRTTPRRSSSTCTRSAPRARATRSASTPHDYEALRRGLRLRGDARPAGRDRGGDRRPQVGQADGPAGLRRRGLRQDRGRAARGVRGGGRRQAGRGAGADDAARRAALPGLLRPLRRLAGEARRAVALPLGEGSQGRARGPRRRHASTSSSARTSCSSRT